jgi:hypothetical protein
VTSQAERFGVGLCQYDLAVFSFRVACGAGILVGEDGVRELLRQLRAVGLMRIVTADAIGRREWLSVVCLDERGVFQIVTIGAECGRVLGEVEVEFVFAAFPGLMCGVTGLATHVESCVTAATLGHVFASLVTAEAEVRSFSTAGGLEKVVLHFGGVRTVTLETVANGWSVDTTFDLGSVFVSMTGNAKGDLGGGDELYAGYFFINPYFVTACTPHGDGRMDDFALRLIFMALNTLRGVGIFLERHGMLACE